MPEGDLLSATGRDVQRLRVHGGREGSMKRRPRVAEASVAYTAGPSGISPDTVRGVVNRIAKHCRPEKIVIFGSYARGEAGPGSDLDLLVVMNSNAPRHKRAAPLRLLFDPTPCPMDILVFTPAEVKRWKGTVNHILTEALDKGIVAYAKPKS